MASDDTDGRREVDVWGDKRYQKLNGYGDRALDDLLRRGYNHAANVRRMKCSSPITSYTQGPRDVPNLKACSPLIFIKLARLNVLFDIVHQVSHNSSLRIASRFTHRCNTRQ